MPDIVKPRGPNHERDTGVLPLAFLHTRVRSAVHYSGKGGKSLRSKVICDQNKTKQKPGNLLLLAPVLVNCRVCSESGPTFLQGENSGLATGPGTELSLGFPPARNYKEHRAPWLEAGAWLSNPHPKMLYGPNRTRYQCVGARGVTPHRPSPL